MAERGRAGGRAEAFGAAARGRRAILWPGRLSDALGPAAAQIRKWLIAEIGPGRLMPWLPIAFGIGIIVYFAAEREPALMAALGLVAGLIVAVFLVRRRAVAFPVLLGAAAAAAGFALATAKSARVAHPILLQPAWNVTLAGWVEVREEREKTDRITIKVHRIEGRRLDQAQERVRIAVRKGTAPPVATFVELKARLNPPLAPLRPGGYDFARDLYFHNIGAIGFALGNITIAEPPGPPSRWLRYAALVGIRNAIDRRIRSSLGGDAGAIASALITGKRDAISAPVNEAMYISGLGHVLSISGYHGPASRIRTQEAAKALESRPPKAHSTCGKTARESTRRHPHASPVLPKA
jgi:competence protein ComEC